MTTHYGYANTGLAQFFLKRIKEWRDNKDRILVPKLQANLNAMQKIDDQRKKRFKKDEGKDWRSDYYGPEIKTKVYTVFATLCDIVFKNDQIQFKLAPSPYEQELIEQDEELRQQSEEDVDLMEDKVKEQQRDFGALKEAKKKLLSSCTYAMSWGAFHVKHINRTSYAKQEFTSPNFGPTLASFEQQEESVNVPGNRYVSVWNMFWDMEDDDIQNNSGLAEFNLISPYEALSFKGQYLYLDDYIDKVVDAYKSNERSFAEEHTLPPGLREIQHRKKGLSHYRFFGRAPRRQVEEFERIIGQMKKGGRSKRTYETLDPSDFNPFGYNEEDTGDEVEIMAELLDEEVIRFARWKDQSRPYHLSVPELTLDGDVPQGLADNMAEDQYLHNGLMRALLDNLRLAGNVLLAIKESLFNDPDKIKGPLKPGSTFDLSDACVKASDAIQQVIIQDVSQGIVGTIGIVDQKQDDHSLVPKIMQGGTLPKQKPDTAYELSQLLENASRYLGMLAKANDQDHIEPDVMDCYRYNMDDPDFGGPQQRGKGNFVCHALGFKSLQDKLIRMQAIWKLLLAFMADQETRKEMKIRDHMEELYRQSDLDPDEFLKSEEEKRIEDEAMKKLREEQAQGQVAAMQQQQELKNQGEVTKTAAKAEADSKLKEEDFQRNITMKAMEKAGGEQKPQKETQGGTA